jgi:hypothetical protein
MITNKEYEQALTIIENYTKCEYCRKIIDRKLSHTTVYYGNVKNWCSKCYESIKDE